MIHTSLIQLQTIYCSTEDFQVHLRPAYLLIALETTLFLQPDESELRLLF